MPPNAGQLLDRQPQQRRGQRGDQAAVGDQHDRPRRLVVGPPLGFTGDQLGDQRHAASWPRRPGSPRRAAPTWRRRATPAGHPAQCVDLGVGHALPVAEMGLAQAVVDPNRRPVRSCNATAVS